MLVLISATVWSGLSNSLSAKSELLVNIGEIARIDEVLTSSALLATATGEAKYVERYFAHVEALDHLLDRSLALFDTGDARRMLEQTDAANGVLVSIEEKALTIKGAPDRDAYATLESEIYLENKRLYSEGVTRAFDELRAIAARDIRTLQRLLVGLMAVTAILCIASFWLFWRSRIDAMDRARREDRINAMKMLISTFMDTQNNLLNNMIFLRTKAAMGGTLGADDVRVIDLEIKRAQQKLAEIAEFEGTAPRDLGGITVLGRKTQTMRSGAAQEAL